MAKAKLNPLSVNDDEGRNKIIEQLNHLRNQPGWKILELHFGSLAKKRESAILNSEGISADKVYTEEDLLKRERKLYLEFINFPEIIIQTMLQSKSQDPQEDPYEDAR